MRISPAPIHPILPNLATASVAVGRLPTIPFRPVHAGVAMLTLSLALLPIASSAQSTAAPQTPVKSLPAPPVPPKNRCSPVTPDTKVPTIESPFLPDFSQGGSYWEWCEDSDYAWRPQSLPNRKYVPERSSEHEARVRLFLERIKAFVSADVDDWVPYVNEMLGVELPAAQVNKRLPLDTEWTVARSRGSQVRLSTFRVDAGYVEVDWSRSLRLPSRRLYEYWRGLTIQLDKASTSLCVTPIDLQAAFEGQRGYVFRPRSIRATRTRPTEQELARLGGQWIGYEVHVFAGVAPGDFDGRMSFNFGYEPCAGHISIRLTKKLEAKETK